MGRFRRVIRWGVYACTLLVLVMFAGSIGKNRTVVKNGMYLYNGRVLLMIYSSPPWLPDDHYDESGIHDLFTRMTLDSDQPGMWFRPVVNLDGRFDERFRADLPLIYPLLAGLAISARLFVVSRRMRRGLSDCGRCGYPLEGIDCGVCPECGVERG